MCGLTYSLHATLDRDSTFADSRQGLIDKFCFVFPLALVVLAYVFDSDEHMDSSVESGVLNVARHSCKCSFRIHLSTLYLMGLFLRHPSQMQHEVFEYDGGVAVASHSSPLEW